jgi:type I restriction enzyme S subunit
MNKVSPKRLGDLITLKRGYDLPEKDRVSGPYPVISSAGVSGFHNEYKVEGQGVVTGRYGTLGEMYFVEVKYWPHNTALYVQDFKGNDPKYIYYLLSCLGRIRTSDKSAVPGVNRNELHEMAIPAIDDKKLQISIRKVLEALDKKIELNNRINAELEAMAKTLYDYWFVQFDFPFDFAKDKPDDSPQGQGKPYKTTGGKMVYNPTLKREIPEGWGVMTIGDYANVKKGTLITEKEANQYGNIKVVSAGLDYSYLHDKSNYPANTITVSASGASAGFINFWREPIFAGDCTVVRGKSDEETIYLLNFLKMRQEFIYQQARGSAQPHVYPKDISALHIEVPPRKLLKKFGEAVLSSNSEMSIRLKQNRKLAQLRDWLLPMLMNGQVTVGEAS